MAETTGTDAYGTAAERPRRVSASATALEKDFALRRLFADKAADWTIRIGGIGVIVAVFGIMVFLAQTVVPCSPARVSRQPHVSPARPVIAR